MSDGATKARRATVRSPERGLGNMTKIDFEVALASAAAASMDLATLCSVTECCVLSTHRRCLSVGER